MDFSQGVQKGFFICNHCDRSWRCGEYGRDDEKIKCPQCGLEVTLTEEENWNSATIADTM